MRQDRSTEKFRSSALYNIWVVAIAVILAIAPAIGTLVRATDQTIDLDQNPANGQESKVTTKVLQTYPVKIENTIYNNAPGFAYLFKWPGAGPGGFSSFVTAGPGVGTKWVWTTVYQVYSIDSPAIFTPSRTVSVFGAPPQGVGTPAGSGIGSFTVPGRSINPSSITLSDASLTSSLVTFFSPEKTVATCSVQCAPGQCDLTLENKTGGTVTMSAQQQDCCLEPHQTICDGECKSYLTDTQNCGGCGNVCLAGEICSDGACVCPPGQTLCGGLCLDLTTDRNNCGACGTVCASDQFCSAGACVCNSGLNECGGSCVDLTTDRLNCGTCGTVCSPDELCNNGSCVCNPGLTECGNACVNLQSDSQHCGACGTTCAADQFCSSGACVCDPGLTQCGAAGCLDLQTDPLNCGACGTVCPANGSCVNGACACNPGLSLCGSTCLDLQNDPRNCGACGAVCEANEICTGGGCILCRAPRPTACNNVCTNTNTDPNNCGGCGDVCDFKNCPSSGQGTCSHGTSCVCAPALTASSISKRIRFKPVHQDRPGRLEVGTSRDTRRTGRTATATGQTGTAAPAPPAAAAHPASPAPKVALAAAAARVTAAPAPGATGDRPAAGLSAPSSAGVAPSTSTGGATTTAAAGRPTALSVTEAPVCDLTPVHQVIPNGGSYTQTQTGGRFGKEIQTTVSIEVNGKTVAQGPCPQIVPVTGADTSGVILSASTVTTRDSSGDGLCQPGEAWCDYLITVADLGDSACLNPVATLSSPPDPFNANAMTFVNDTSAYPNFPPYPGDGVPLDKKVNLTEFTIAPPSSQAPDVGRPFLVSVECSNMPAPVLMPITIGFGSACDPNNIDGKSYDHLNGLQGPVNAPLVVEGNPVNYSSRTFNQGSTIPLKLTLSCGSLVLNDAQIDPNPQIIAVVHSTLGPQPLTGINGANNANPDDPQFSCSSTACDYQFRTVQLPVGTYVVSIRMPDTRVFQAGFTITP